MSKKTIVREVELKAIDAITAFGRLSTNPLELRWDVLPGSIIDTGDILGSADWYHWDIIPMKICAGRFTFSITMVSNEFDEGNEWNGILFTVLVDGHQIGPVYKGKFRLAWDKEESRYICTWLFEDRYEYSFFNRKVMKEEISDFWD
jgi:hypothetical protein